MDERVARIENNYTTFQEIEQVPKFREKHRQYRDAIMESQRFAIRLDCKRRGIPTTYAR